MARASDTNRISNKVEKQRQKLANADIDDGDRDAIQRFVDHRRAHGAKHGSYAASTQRADLRDLRLAAERADVSLLDMGIDDVNRLLNLLKDEYGVTTGIDSYTRVLRPFFRWLDRHDGHGDFGWWQAINTGNIDFDEPSDRRFPTPEEIDAAVSEARANQSPRDVAILRFYADAAVRLTLGSQLLAGSLSFSGDRPTFTPNPDGEMQKGVEPKPYPLYDSVADLRTWANSYHPDPENDDAPLWTPDAAEYRKRRDPDFCHKCREGGHDDAETCPDCGEKLADGGALTAKQIRRIIQKYFERAGVNTDDVETKPHALRHAAVGRWKERGYGLAQVQRRTAWTDKAAAEMWAKYGDPDDDATDAEIDRLEGEEPATADDADDAEPAPTRRACGNCRADGITADYCPDCGAPVSPGAKAASTDDAAEEDEARIREIVETTVRGMLGVDDDADMGERAEAGAARLAVLAEYDDLPDPDPLGDLMAREGLTDEDIDDVDLSRGFLQPAEEGDG